MKRLLTAGTAAVGVAHVEKIVAGNQCIFHRIAQENDVGIDAFIEIVVDGHTTGCCIGVQIKSGESYIESGRHLIRADARHVTYWREHVLPIAGVVYNPKTDEARWVDLTKDLESVSLGQPFTFVAKEPFNADSIPAFSEHFQGYAKDFSDDRHFACALRGLADRDDIQGAASALHSLFSFHRNKAETWFYLLAALRFYRGHALLRNIVVAMAHVPGHGDIFWGPNNILSTMAEEAAKNVFRKLISRDDIITLIDAIDGNGLGRGSVGQCVDAIVGLCPERNSHLESIAIDPILNEEFHFRACILLISSMQWRELAGCVKILERIIPHLTDEALECVTGLFESLKQNQLIDFWF